MRLLFDDTKLKSKKIIIIKIYLTNRTKSYRNKKKLNRWQKYYTHTGLTNLNEFIKPEVLFFQQKRRESSGRVEWRVYMEHNFF